MLKELSKIEYSDPAIVAGDVYKLLLENDRIRVFDVRFKPGQKAVMHAHPDHVVYVLADGTLKLTLPDGKSQEIPLKAGEAMWIGAGPHATENVGRTEAHNLAIELKEPHKH